MSQKQLKMTGAIISHTLSEFYAQTHNKHKVEN